MKVSWANESIRTRQFRAALRISTLFLEHLSGFDPPATVESPHMQLWEKLKKRWGLLSEDGDQTPDQYCERMRQLLGSAEGLGESVFHRMEKDLQKPWKCDPLLLTIGKQSFDELEQCVHEWGGAKAKARFENLKQLPVQCETNDGRDTRLSFERDQKRILLRVGDHESLLQEAMILHFSFFHEYLSHSFPSWSKDQESISEGLLFALEFSWFQSRNTMFESELLGEAWKNRLAGKRGAFRTGQWLLDRCDASPHCVAAFFLEWVAGWPMYSDKVHSDLLSQLIGIATKITSRFDNRDKEQRTKKLLEQALCRGCSNKVWDLSQLTVDLAAVLKPYGSQS